MSDVEPENEDEKLREDLLEYGEEVGKITDKNREILVKKLNHFRARRRMSEKLSASLLKKACSPKRTGGKGPGKKPAAGVDETNATGNLSKRLSISLENIKVPERLVVGSKSCSPEKAVKDDDIAPSKRANEAQSEDNGGETAPGKRTTGRVGRPKATSTRKSSSRTSNVQSLMNDTKAAAKTGRKTAVQQKEGVLDEAIVVEDDESLASVEDIMPSSTQLLQSTSRKRIFADPVQTDELMKEQYKSHAAENLNSREASAVSFINVGNHQTYGRGRKSVRTAVDSSKSEKKTEALSSAPLVAELTRPPLSKASIEVDTVSSSSDAPKLTVQVIDSTIGQPAANVSLSLHYEGSIGVWSQLGYHVTDKNGKYVDFTLGAQMMLGTYRLHIDTGGYFYSTSNRSCFPYIDVMFNVDDIMHPVCLQILLGRFGYSVNRIR